MRSAGENPALSGIYGNPLHYWVRKNNPEANGNISHSRRIARATARNLTGQIDYQELPGAPHWLLWGELEDRVTAMVVDWVIELAEFNNA